ncbi:MAG: YdcF family protein, partial [Mycobacterium sp.]|nr:YdcF family protein [Mycobacterium sp.]
MGQHVAVDLELIDPHAGAVRNADLIFIFGTRHWTPAELAADLYHAGRAPFVVTTGGPQRHPRGISEAEVHQRLLVAAGVPEDAVIVENRSATTVENVTMSAPLIAQTVGPVRTVIAVVKWYHRRALVTLAAQAPYISRIYAADYEPFNADS